jgi:endo-1,4-beta-xylanase
MKKKLNKSWNLALFTSALAIVALSYCKKDMEWGRDEMYGEVAAAELPLALREAISRYEPLKNYAKDFPIGIGMSEDLYNSDEVYRNIVNANFQEVTISNSMKHRWMVNASGQLNFTTVDAVMDKFTQAGLKVYGHTLIWHQNQNASYLNSLLAPTVVPVAGGSLLNVNALRDGTFTGWNRNNGTGMSIVQNGGLNNGPAVRFSVAAAGDEWATQLTTPDITAIPGHQYEVSFWIKSDNAGGGRVSFAGMSNNYPWVDGAGTFTTSGTWKQVKYNTSSIGSAWTATADKIKASFDLGKTAGVYYIDINSISVIDKDAPVEAFNYATNGGFETGVLGTWAAANPGAGITVSNEDKHAGTYAAKLISSATSSQPWNLQLQTPSITLTAGKDYTLSFYVKSNAVGKGRISFPGLSSEYPWMNWQGTGAAEAFSTGTSWSLISVDLDDLAYSGANTSLKLSFDMGYLPNVTYYIDDVKLVEKGATGGGGQPLIIEKTEAEKKQIITNAMQSWISGMVGHYKGKVHAWDVVNEAMTESGGLRTGTAVVDKAADEFYWQDYMGRDFAVEAFKYAKLADPDAKLFINDYNLETGSLAKLNGLIEYVREIETKGAVVDGIGTQMHVSLTSNKENIASMFTTMAATGKLVKVTELDIQVGTNSPTLEQYAEQAEMYRYIVEMYKKHVPKSQQYGITVWSVSDNEREHEYWIPNDGPNLWDKDYQRKHAYKGFADGLAGKDVSSEFSGELQK